MNTIKDTHNNEVEYESLHIEVCDQCMAPILCYQTKEGSIIEHEMYNGFILWGPFGLCLKCTRELSKEIEKLRGELKKMKEGISREFG